MHRKKILAVAVAGALSIGSAGVAFAAGDEERFTIYGKLYPQVSRYDFSGAARPGETQSSLESGTSTSDTAKRSSLDVGNSRIGFRGTEGLGGNLRAIWQIEQRVRFDTGSGNVWAGNRDSFLGLSGSLGSFKVGNMDTAYKVVGDKLSFLGISSGNFVASSNVLSRGPTGGIDFHLRKTNVMMYESPKVVGIQFIGSWAKDEDKGNPNRALNAILNSYGIAYEMGPLYLALGHEIHKDFFGTQTYGTSGPQRAFPGVAAGNRSDERATRATGMYKLGQTTLSLDVAELDLKESEAPTGGFASYKNRRIALGVEQKFGNITGAVSMVNSDKGTCTLVNAPCDTVGLEGRLFNVGASYEFSRRTQAFAIFSKLENGVSAGYSNVGTSLPDPQNGEDITAFAVGVSHSF
jgi:predicted porin